MEKAHFSPVIYEFTCVACGKAERNTYPDPPLFWGDGGGGRLTCPDCVAATDAASDAMADGMAEAIARHAELILKASGSDMRRHADPAVRDAILDAVQDLWVEAWAAGANEVVRIFEVAIDAVPGLGAARPAGRAAIS